MSEIIYTEKEIQMNEEQIYSSGTSYVIPTFSNILNESIQNPKYKLNSYHLTCSCKVYRERAKLYKKRDIRRLCKHLFSELLSKHTNDIDPLTKLLLETYFWFGRQILFKIKFENRDVFFCVKLPIQRIYVFAKKDDKWKRYVYNFIEDFWDNSTCPENDIALIVKIKKEIKRKLNIKYDESK